MVRMFQLVTARWAAPPPVAGDSDERPSGRPSSGRLRKSFTMRVQGRAGSRRRIILAATLLLAVMGAGLTWASGLERSTLEVTLDLGQPNVFHDLPPFIADLKPGDGKPHYIKLGISIEVPHGDGEAIAESAADIRDAIQVRLREYERGDLEGKVGAERLRADLLALINQTMAHTPAYDVLYREFILD